jgi:hypothetical protein
MVYDRVARAYTQATLLCRPRSMARVVSDMASPPEQRGDTPTLPPTVAWILSPKRGLPQPTESRWQMGSTGSSFRGKGQPSGSRFTIDDLPTEVLSQLASIRANLTLDLLSPAWRSQVFPGDPPEKGHCYVASEAAYHLFGRRLGFQPHVVQLEGGGTHWWLQHPVSGHIIDPTRSQVAEDFDYGAGRACRFLPTPGGRPSKRAQTLIVRVRNQQT